MPAMAASGNVAYAAHVAGFSHEQTGHSAMRRPAVAAEVARLQLERIQNELLPLAVQRHIAVLRDKTVTGQPLNRAIEMAYKYGLGDKIEPNKEPHEMNAEELAHAIAALERAASDKAKHIDAAPVDSGVFD